jgi:hypothetical protein
MDMRHNKQLINDEMTLVKITSGVSEPKITIAMLMKTLTEFMIEQRKFNEEQRQFNQYVINRLDKIEMRLDKLDARIDNLVKLNNLKE